MVNHRRMTLSDRLSLIPNPSSIAKNSLQDSSVQPKAYLNERYRVLDLIGQGGFGRTFLAIEESHSVESPCVIKRNYSGWRAGKIGVSIKTSLRASRTGIPCLRRVER